METRTYTVYKFDELPEDGKKAAIEKWRETTLHNGDFFWNREWMESIKQGLHNFGAELQDWSIDFLGDDRSWWKISIDSETQEEITGMRLRTWLLNNHWDNFFKRKHYGEYIYNKETEKGRYQRYSRCQWIETSCPFTGYCGDEDFMDVFRDFIKKPDNSTFKELLEDAVRRTVKAMQADCNYQISDEGITEIIQCNEYDFTEDGELA